MQVTTLPVYSKLADPAKLPKELADCLPATWQLSLHQLATYEALGRDNVDVVINTAMTGDGKSLAGLLPLLADDRHEGTLALYPTNELIRDQAQSAKQTLPAWKRPGEWTSMLFGAQLDALTAEVEELRRPDTLMRELNSRRLLLSNPDILHAILQFHYQQYGRSPDQVVARLVMQFSQLTFDEFHIFETPQVVAVLTGLLFLLTQRPQLKTLLLSATPSDEVLDLLARTGLRVHPIVPQREGWYHHGADPGQGWRPILQGSTLTVVPQSAEEWLAAGGDQIILDWFATHRPGARAALIVNSAATALRLVARLKPLLESVGLTVEPNTGITGYRVRQDSYQADLLVATSTVDVGVDFRINLLIFEANSASTFLQRLGRLGRHTSYRDRDYNEHPFQAFAAYALVPGFIHARLGEPAPEQSAPLQDGASYTREALAQKVVSVFPRPTSFRQYIRYWGRFVPARVIYALSDKAIRATYASVREKLMPNYTRLIQGSLGAALREWKDRQTFGEGLLIEEAQSFRGGSPFECGVFKEDEGALVTYDLFWLLAHGHLELMSREAFCATARRLGQPDTPYKRGYQKFFFRWRDLRPTREQVRILLGPAVARWGPERHQVAQILPGLQVDCNGHADLLDQLNQRLIEFRCVGLIVPGFEPRQLYRTCYLPPTMELFPYEARSDGGDRRGTIAFGRDALLLDSRLRSRPVGGTPDAPLIF